MKSRRTLATVLFTDIVGSTEQAAAIGDRAWRELLARHHRIVREEIRRWGGEEVTEAGDGFLALFATSIRRRAVSRRWPPRGGRSSWTRRWPRRTRRWPRSGSIRTGTGRARRRPSGARSS